MPNMALYLCNIYSEIILLTWLIEIPKANNSDSKAVSFKG